MGQFHRSRDWATFVKRMRPVLQGQVDAGIAACVDCGRPVLPGQRWQVGHRLPASTHPQFRLAEWNVGPSHAMRGLRCNQKAGGTLGANKTNAKRKQRKGHIEW